MGQLLGCVILEGFMVREELDGRVGCSRMQSREELSCRTELEPRRSHAAPCTQRALGTATWLQYKQFTGDDKKLSVLSKAKF